MKTKINRSDDSFSSVSKGKIHPKMKIIFIYSPKLDFLFFNQTLFTIKLIHMTYAQYLKSSKVVQYLYLRNRLKFKLVFSKKIDRMLQLSLRNSIKGVD